MEKRRVSNTKPVMKLTIKIRSNGYKNQPGYQGMLLSVNK
jgi:hypothetical protein